MLNLNPSRIRPLRPSSLCSRLGSIKRQPCILHLPPRLHRKRNMTIHSRRHGAIKPTHNLIILLQPRVANLVERIGVLAEGGAKVVLIADEFGAGEGGAGEGVVEGFGGWFCGWFSQGCLGFCGGGGGGEVGDLFLDAFAQVDE
jgi:hypothetical protein